MTPWHTRRTNISEAIIAVEDGGDNHQTLRAYVAKNGNLALSTDGARVQEFSLQAVDLTTGDEIDDPILLNTQDIMSISEGTYVPPTPSTSSTSSPAGSPSISACFSKHNQVEVFVQSSALAAMGLDGKVKSVELSDLKIGDLVRTGPSSFSRLYAFGHFDPTATAEYIQIHYSLPSSSITISAANNNDMDEKPPLEITPDHMVFVVKNNDGIKQAIPASRVQIGDELILAGIPALSTDQNPFKQQNDNDALNLVKVTNLDLITRATGAYAPFTDDGTIVVSGVAASCYVSMQPLVSSADGSSGMLQIGSWATPFSMQWLSHFVTAPRRMVCSFFMASICEKEAYNADGIATWVATPFAVARWVFQGV